MFQFLIKIHFWIVGRGVLQTIMTTKERMFNDGRIYNKRNPCLVGKSLEITHIFLLFVSFNNQPYVVFFYKPMIFKFRPIQMPILFDMHYIYIYIYSLIYCTLIYIGFELKLVSDLVILCYNLYFLIFDILLLIYK